MTLDPSGPEDWDLEALFDQWRETSDLLFVSTPPRLPPAPENPQVSEESDSVAEVASSDLSSIMGDFESWKTAILQRLMDADDQAEKDAAKAELDALIREQTTAVTQKQTRIAELEAQVTVEQQARNEAQAEALLERTRNRRVKEQLESTAVGRRTLMELSRISGGVPSAAADAASAAASAPASSSTSATGANQQSGNVGGQQRTQDDRLINDPDLAVYQLLERLNSTSFLNSIDAQSTVLAQRPDLFQNPTPDHLYDMAHRLTNAPVSDATIREDLKQAKIMMQKSMLGYLKFSGIPGKAASWEQFEIQMRGLVNQAVFKERELAVVLWGLLEGDAQLFLMSKGIFQGDSYTKMFETLKKAFKRKPAAVLQDMSQCTQGPSESVLAYTARFRIISASTFPEQPSTHRVVDGSLVVNPLAQAETMKYKAMLVSAHLQAQHHYMQGLRQDIRRRMRKLKFDTVDEAETEALEAEEELQDLGDLKEHPNPLVKPQINMLRGQKGKGQKGQGQAKKFEGECYSCHKYGHRANECRSKPSSSSNNNNNNNNRYQGQSRSQQDENAHVHGAINAVKGQLNRSLSRESRVSHRGRSASPRGRSPRGKSGSSARGQVKRGRDGSRNRDRVSFSSNNNSNSGHGKYKQKGRLNALHGAAQEEGEEDGYDSATSGNE